jgi:hypothetical protein
MNAATVRHKPITCPNCKTEQRLPLLAVPDCGRPVCSVSDHPESTGCNGLLYFSPADFVTQGFAINRFTRASSAALDSLSATH